MYDGTESDSLYDKIRKDINELSSRTETIWRSNPDVTCGHIQKNTIPTHVLSSKRGTNSTIATHCKQSDLIQGKTIETSTNRTDVHT